VGEVGKGEGGEGIIHLLLPQAYTAVTAGKCNSMTRSLEISESELEIHLN